MIYPMTEILPLMWQPAPLNSADYGMRDDEICENCSSVSATPDLDTWMDREKAIALWI